MIEQGIAAICAHTNLDAAEGGVNTALALRLGLRDRFRWRWTAPTKRADPTGVGRVGQLEGGPMTVDHFARRAKETLGLSGIRVLDAGVPSNGWQWAAAPAAVCCPRSGPWGVTPS